MAHYDTFLFTGHGLDLLGVYDPGAVYQGNEEHQIATMITDQVRLLLDQYQLNVQYGEQNFKNNLLKGNTYNFKKGLSVHINSASGGATGSEILIPCKQVNLDYERELIRQVSDQLQIKNRGMKSRDYHSGDFITRSDNKPINKLDYYGEIREAQNVGIDLSILEVGFIQTDLPTIKNNIKEIAQIITEYYLAFTHATVKPSGGNEIFYRVVVGSFKNRANAEKLSADLSQDGYDPFIVIYEK